MMISRQKVEKVETVTWKGLLYTLSGVLTTLVFALVTLGAWALSEHAQHPHAGAVSDHELNLVLQRISSLDEDIKELRTDIKTLIAR